MWPQYRHSTGEESLRNILTKVASYLVVVSMDLFLAVGHLEDFNAINDSHDSSVRESRLLFAIRMEVFNSAIREYYLLHATRERLLHLFTARKEMNIRQSSTL